MEDNQLPKGVVKGALFTAAKDCDLYELLYSVDSMGIFQQNGERKRLCQVLALVLKGKDVSTLKSTGKRTPATENAYSGAV